MVEFNGIKNNQGVRKAVSGEKRLSKDKGLEITHKNDYKQFCLYKEVFIVVEYKSALKENRGQIFQNPNQYMYIQIFSHLFFTL